MADIRKLAIESIRLDFQASECLDPETVHRYAVAISAFEKIEPVLVYFDGELFWLADGFHRVAALLSVGIPEVAAEVVPGTFADLEAEWHRYMDALRTDWRSQK